MSENDRNLIKDTLKSPGWGLLEKKMRENASTYRFIAEQPEVDEHYRLILFAKAQGIEEMFNESKNFVK